MLQTIARRRLATMAAPRTPMEDAIRLKVGSFYGHETESDKQQLTEALNPTSLTIHNDSHLHAHHKAMAGSTSKETHFRYVEPVTGQLRLICADLRSYRRLSRATTIQPDIAWSTACSKTKWLPKVVYMHCN